MFLGSLLLANSAGATAVGFSEMVKLNRSMADSAITVHTYTFGKFGLDRPTTLYNMAAFHNLVRSYIQYVDSHTRLGTIQNPVTVEKHLLNIVAKAQHEIDLQFADLEEHQTALALAGVDVKEWKQKASAQLTTVTYLLWGNSPLIEVLSGNFNPRGDATAILESKKVMELQRQAIKKVYDEQYAIASSEKADLSEVPRI